MHMRLEWRREHMAGHLFEIFFGTLGAFRLRKSRAEAQPTSFKKSDINYAMAGRGKKSARRHLAARKR